MEQTIVALVPMKHTSERTSQKNYRNFNGKPLYYWILNTLSKCSSISKIYINTDSSVIAEHVSSVSKKIIVIDRPGHLCGGNIPMTDILAYDVTHVSGEYFLQTHVTNPLLKLETIEKAIETFFSSKESDSLFSVTRSHVRLWDAYGNPINHNPLKLERTQDLSPIFEENSNIYIFSRKTLLSKKSRIGSKPILFEIQRNEAWDIDEEIDFTIAQILQSLTVI